MLNKAQEDLIICQSYPGSYFRSLSFFFKSPFVCGTFSFIFSKYICLLVAQATAVSKTKSLPSCEAYILVGRANPWTNKWMCNMSDGGECHGALH